MLKPLLVLALGAALSLLALGCCCNPESYEALMDTGTGVTDVPVPTDEEIRADLLGKTFVFAGTPPNARTWTIAAGEITHFEVATRSTNPSEGYTDADVLVALESERVVITGTLRVEYSFVEDSWQFQAIYRWPDEDFTVQEKETSLSTQDADEKSCDAIDEQAMCWQYSASALIDLGEDYTQEACDGNGGSWAEGGCTSTDRRGNCSFEDGYRIYYYEGFKDINPGMNMIRHCRESGGKLKMAGGKRAKGPRKRPGRSE